MSATATSPPWDLLARQLAGEATPADEAAVRAWQAVAPANAVLWQQLTGVWTEAGAASTPPIFGPADTVHAWQQFEATVLGPPPASPTAPGPSAPSPGGFSGVGGLAGWGKGAALLVAGVGAGWLLRTAVPPAAEATLPASVTTQAPARADSIRSVAAVDLIFENEALRAVALRVEAAFPGTRVEVTDAELAQQRFTGTFRAAQPAAVLRVVSVATGAELLQRGSDSTWVLARPAR